MGIGVWGVITLTHIPGQEITVRAGSAPAPADFDPLPLSAEGRRQAPAAAAVLATEATEAAEATAAAEATRKSARASESGTITTRGKEQGAAGTVQLGQVGERSCSNSNGGGVACHTQLGKPSPLQERKAA